MNFWGYMCVTALNLRDLFRLNWPVINWHFPNHQIFRIIRAYLWKARKINHQTQNKGITTSCAQKWQIRFVRRHALLSKNWVNIKRQICLMMIWQRLIFKNILIERFSCKPKLRKWLVINEMRMKLTANIVCEPLTFKLFYEIEG